MSGDVLTGFVSESINVSSNIMTLTFNSVDPGDAFVFTIDVDDNNTRVDSARIAGAEVTATFNWAGGTDLVAAMVAGGSDDTTWSANTDAPAPEPGPPALVSPLRTPLVPPVPAQLGSGKPEKCAIMGPFRGSVAE